MIASWSMVMLHVLMAAGMALNSRFGLARTDDSALSIFGSHNVG